MKILITGISGFLAGYLSENFVSQGHTVIGISHSNVAKLYNEIDHYFCHLPDQKIYEIIKNHNPDVVIHAAGTASVPMSVENPYDDFSISVPGTAMLLDAIRLHSPLAHFIFFSSAAVYGNPQNLPINEDADVSPISPYGYHKRMGELLCEEYSTIYGLNCTILRIFSAYGKGLQRQVVYDMAMKLLMSCDSKEILDFWGTGSESRDFIHAKDIVQAVELIIHEKHSGYEIFNCASGQEVHMKTLAEKIKVFSNKSESYSFNGQTRKGDPINWKANIGKLKKMGFNPEVSLEDGIKEIIEWIKA